MPKGDALKSQGATDDDPTTSMVLQTLAQMGQGVIAGANKQPAAPPNGAASE